MPTGRYIDGARRPLLVVCHEPRIPVVGRVLVVPPFAEEMNKCRRSVTVLAQSLATRGIATVVPDLAGTGDSYGDFCEVGWAEWRGDLAAVTTHFHDSGAAIDGVLAVRLGAALALEFLNDSQGTVLKTLACWQPVFDGKRSLQQFLRLKLAAEMMAGGDRETVQSLRDKLRDGEVLDVAGYPLSPSLATELERVQMTRIANAGGAQVHVFEVSADVADPCSRTTLALCDLLRGAGAQCDARVVPGMPFWNAAEIVVEPALIDATCAALLKTYGLQA